MYHVKSLFENSQTRISPLIFIKLMVVALIFFFFALLLSWKRSYNTVYFQVNGLLTSFEHVL